MKYTNCVVVLLSAFVLTGCSSFSSSDDEETLGTRVINYQEVEGEITDLIIPPDLTNPESQGYFVTISGGVSDSSSSGVQLAKVSNVEVRRDAYRRWLLVDKTPSEIWPLAKEFLQSFGFKIKKEDEALGIIETEYLESDPDVPDSSLGGFRAMLSDILKAKYALPIADKYRIRIEATDDKSSSEVYLSLRSIEEVVIDETTLWQSRAKDAELETEMLLRLMVFLGSDQSDAINKIQETAEVEKLPVSVYKTKSGYATLVFPYDPPKAWAHLGWAMDELDIDIEDSDPFEQSYYVNLVRTNDRGFFSKLMGKSAETISVQLVVKQLEEGHSQVVFNDLSEENEQKTIDFSFIFFKELADQF
ncbi:MAG TPA: outer membrane protein assembly factor BamC [Candidatus Thioglobus sp.]|jgi:outer membrane protein assembly factor BamC|nr:outer membrane protein assembly factor BamC [Candidatus Thioglobus sp.]HIL20308.1 outer membrane protein assembly factor BamC [Candidatus Thioglobus sp.]